MEYFRIDQDMLPMKGHYFLFNAGTAPLVPYLPTYAKQLGFSSYVVGIIYTFLPIFGLFAKPIFGAIADRYEKHKTVFILFQILTIAAFSCLYFIPDDHKPADVRLSCGDGETFFSICPRTSSLSISRSVDKIVAINATTECTMSCSMDNPFMWQTVCEHWKVPKYCYTSMPELNFTAYLPKQRIRSVGDCAYFTVQKTKMSDGLEYEPRCSNKINENLRTTCRLFCPHKTIITFLAPSKNSVNLFCEKNETYLNTCSHSKEGLQTFVTSINNEPGDVDCVVTCDMDSPTKWLDMCLGWAADESQSCQPAGNFVDKVKLNFTGIVPLGNTIDQGECAFFNVKSTIFPDGSRHYPQCPKTIKPYSHFHSKCETWCDNAEVTDFLRISNATDEKDEPINYQTLSIFFSLMVLNWIGMAVVVSIADAICFEKLGTRADKYGHQRLWGSVGWGIFSLLAGFLIDQFSRGGEEKNYMVAFIMMFIMLALDVIVSSRLQYKQKSVSVNIFKKVGVLFTNVQTCHFFLWIVMVGMCTGVLWQFLFWYLEDLANMSDDQIRWIKTLQGLVSVLQTFLGEIPFFFFSGRILKKIGHINTMSLVLMGFGIRFILYSLLSNPWWVLPIELLQGITFGMSYATMASYASIIAPSGTEATIQGLVGAIFEGVGTSLGSFIGGVMYENLGGALAFRIFGLTALVACLINILLSRFVFKKTIVVPENQSQEYSSIIRYAAPNDAIDMLSEHDITP